MSDVMEKIRTRIESNPILLFMKGTPEFPQCGFSSRTVQILMACGVEFAYVNVLEEPEVRSTLPRYANWPTFPQLYVNGELVGGCDITMEMFKSGELERLLKDATAT